MRGVSLREKKSAVRRRAPAHERRFGSGGYVEYLIDPRRPHSFPTSLLLFYAAAVSLYLAGED